MIEATSSEKAQVIFGELKEECERFFQFEIKKSTPIIRGWLNLKWKIETDAGVYVLKQYNEDRYKLYNQNLLVQALQEQQRLHNNGIRCPRLLTYKSDIIHTSKSNERFIVMEYKEGKMLLPGKLNKMQINSLGQMIGRMHKLLNDGSLMKGKNTHFMPSTKEEQLLHWEKVMEEAERIGKQESIPFIKLQKEVTKSVNTEKFYTSLKGWAHRDLWVDNFLFHNDELSAIVDFDRMGYDYLDLDIGRAVISCALNNRKLDIELVATFLDGYRTELDFPIGGIVRSIQMLWYMESKWWIPANMDQHSVPPTRFAEEMLWIAENYEELHKMLEYL
ncbi:homoserine kinase [Bacillus clarus]|uniref:Homoserine kinase n=1 Tax=Bacillus clarus TaxID=2338372 RepID=A0A090Z171_9BACI|nr:phosphotransferase [Bacillus clarus]KFN04397.1 phosphotransferase enzyme family protein [Bacillus clarus]RFT63260.1 homoserine kinase [Bacillus clarus]